MDKLVFAIIFITGIAVLAMLYGYSILNARIYNKHREPEDLAPKTGRRKDWIKYNKNVKKW